MNHTLEQDAKELRDMAAQYIEPAAGKEFFLRVAQAVSDYHDLLRDNRVTGPGYTPNSNLPPLGDLPRRKMLIEIEVSEDFEKRLDNQWMVEREIHADRWKWRWL